MRPVNLIPPESRRGQHAPLRSGPLPYIAVGALVAVLLGVTALVLAGNQISDSKADITRLEAENSVAEARAEKLAAFTQFRTMREQRVATVTSLADSRFDWQRVMRELALVLPADTWLNELTATASSDAQVEGGGQLRQIDPGAGARTQGVRDGPGGGRRVRHGAEGHRRRHQGRGRVLRTAETGIRRRRPGCWQRLRRKRLQDPQLHRLVPDHGRLRCGAGAGQFERGDAPHRDRTGADDLGRQLLGRRLRRKLGRRLR